MDFIFLPVAGGSHLPSRTDKFSMPLSWFDERLKESWGINYNPNIMLSYVYWNQERFNYRSRPDTFVFGDSGGHSVMTLGISLAPEDVLRWQMASVHAGAILDVPPFADDKTGHNIPWAEALDSTCTNVERALPYYESYRKGKEGIFGWWGVVQGRDWEEMYKWWSRIADVYPFTATGEGWAFNPLGGQNLATIAASMGFLARNNLQRVHALGTGGVSQVAVLYCLALLGGFERVSFDSTNCCLYAVNKKLFTSPKKLGQACGIILKDKVEAFQRQCSCLACSTVREHQRTSITPEHGLAQYETLMREQHNLLVYQQAYRDVYAACGTTPEEFLHKTYPNDYGSIMRGYEEGKRVDLHRHQKTVHAKGGLLDALT